MSLTSTIQLQLQLQPLFSPLLAILGYIPRWLLFCLLLVPLCHAFNAVHDRIAPPREVRAANTFAAGMTVRMLCWVFKDLFKDKDKVKDKDKEHHERITSTVVLVPSSRSYSYAASGSGSHSQWYSKSFVHRFTYTVDTRTGITLIPIM
jgi:hypothetical protein